MSMLRTQIYLPEEIFPPLDEMAGQFKVPRSAVIRLILQTGLKSRTEWFPRGNDLWKMADLKIKGGVKNLSQNLDNYLYE